jgi:hypothetical protein
LESLLTVANEGGESKWLEKQIEEKVLEMAEILGMDPEKVAASGDSSLRRRVELELQEADRARALQGLA